MTVESKAIKAGIAFKIVIHVSISECSKTTYEIAVIVRFIPS